MTGHDTTLQYWTVCTQYYWVVCHDCCRLYNGARVPKVDDLLQNRHTQPFQTGLQRGDAKIWSLYQVFYPIGSKICHCTCTYIQYTKLVHLILALVQSSVFFSLFDNFHVFSVFFLFLLKNHRVVCIPLVSEWLNMTLHYNIEQDVHTWKKRIKNRQKMARPEIFMIEILCILLTDWLTDWFVDCQMVFLAILLVIFRPQTLFFCIGSRGRKMNKNTVYNGN